MPADRSINLVILPDQSLSFGLRFKRTLITYSISSNGKITDTDTQEGVARLPGAVVSMSGIPHARSNRTDNNKKNDDQTYTNFITSYGEVVVTVKGDRKVGKILLTYFKK